MVVVSVILVNRACGADVEDEPIIFPANVADWSVPSVSAVVPLLVCKANTPDASPVLINPLVDPFDALIVLTMVTPN